MPSSDEIAIVDPVTGAPLLSGVTLNGCYMLIGAQIFTYAIPRTGPQHSAFIKDPLVLDCQSYAIGLTLLTHASQGQIHSLQIVGNLHGGGSSSTS
jgi:hypothetical protein